MGRDRNRPESDAEDGDERFAMSTEPNKPPPPPLNVQVIGTVTVGESVEIAAMTYVNGHESWRRNRRIPGRSGASSAAAVAELRVHLVDAMRWIELGGDAMIGAYAAADGEVPARSTPRQLAEDVLTGRAEATMSTAVALAREVVRLDGELEEARMIAAATHRRIADLAPVERELRQAETRSALADVLAGARLVTEDGRTTIDLSGLNPPTEDPTAGELAVALRAALRQLDEAWANVPGGVRAARETAGLVDRLYRMIGGR